MTNPFDALNTYLDEWPDDCPLPPADPYDTYGLIDWIDDLEAWQIEQAKIFEMENA